MIVVGRERLLPPPVSELRMLDETVRRCRAAVDPGLSEYLDGRGIPAGAIDSFRLGVVPGTDAPPLLSGHEGWLVIPYLNAAGVCGMRLRHLPSAGPLGDRGKYFGLPGEPSRLFNTRVLASHETRVVHVMEGELDAVAASEQLGWSCVAAPGASSWQARHGILCRGFERVYVWGDGDGAGREFNHRVRETLRSAIPVQMPDGFDVSALLMVEGPEGVEALRLEADRLWGLA